RPRTRLHLPCFESLSSNLCRNIGSARAKRREIYTLWVRMRKSKGNREFCASDGVRRVASPRASSCAGCNALGLENDSAAFHPQAHVPDTEQEKPPMDRESIVYILAVWFVGLLAMVACFNQLSFYARMPYVERMRRLAPVCQQYRPEAERINRHLRQM